MLPNKTCDSITCLESLVKVRADCTDDCAPFYVEDIEGVDSARLSELATVNSPSGKTFGSDLVSISAREMLADIELLIGNGYSLKPTFGELCSACTFLTTYTANTRVKVKNLVATSYSILHIHTLQILTNYTGTAGLIVDDGTPTSYSVELENGIISTATLEYSTTAKTVMIYFQDTSIGLAQINCKTSSGCGCGEASNKGATQTINYSGMIGLAAAPFQYGFLVCASVACSSDLMVCDLIRQTPNIFAMTLLYKVGAKYYSDARLSVRNNRTAGQDEEKKIDMQEYYAALYKQRLYGSKTTKSIYSMVSGYLKQRNDKCVICEGNVKQGWAIG